MNAQRAIAGLTTLLLASLTGCEQPDPLAPPSVRLGEDECSVCRMIISDDRYAAAVVVLDEYDRHQALAFDDIGCMFEYEAANAQTPILAQYVKNRETRQWLHADAAELLHSRDLHTPMAFGMAALDSLQAARVLQNEFGGDLITLAEARRRFAAGTLHVSSVDDPGDDAGDDAAPLNEKTLRLSDGRELQLTLLTPQSLAPGKHAFELAVHGPVGDELKVQIEPDMPSMGHGSPGNEHPQLVSENLYRGLVNFTMAGPWLVHVSFTEHGRELGRTAFSFEVLR